MDSMTAGIDGSAMTGVISGIGRAGGIAGGGTCGVGGERGTLDGRWIPGANLATVCSWPGVNLVASVSGGRDFETAWYPADSREWLDSFVL